MELTYIVQRSARRRKLTITVERDRSVVVHAPEGVSDEKIQQVVESKRQWIYEKIGHPQKYQDLPHAPGKELVSGESALYLGRQYRIEMVKNRFIRDSVHPAFPYSGCTWKEAGRCLTGMVYQQGQRKDCPAGQTSRS